MSTVVLFLAFLALLMLVAGSSRIPAIRLASRIVSLLGLSLFGLITLASVYAMFTLGGKGGGIFLLVAIPSAIIAALFLYSLTCSQATERFVELPPRVQAQQTRVGIDQEIFRLQARLADAEGKVHDFWLTPATRQRLRRSIAADKMMLVRLRELQSALPASAAADSGRGGSPARPIEAGIAGIENDDA